jgi:hypothetical protein
MQPSACLFLIDDLFDDQTWQLGHQRPQPGIFFQQNNHVSIQIVVETVVIVLKTRIRNWIIVAPERRIHVRHDKNSLRLNSIELGRLRIDNARKSPMIRRPNLDGSMGIAAGLQQTGGGLFGAFKLTADDTTPKERSRRRARCGRIVHELQMLRPRDVRQHNRPIHDQRPCAWLRRAAISGAAPDDNNCVWQSGACEARPARTSAAGTLTDILTGIPTDDSCLAPFESLKAIERHNRTRGQRLSLHQYDVQP